MPVFTTLQRRKERRGRMAALPRAALCPPVLGCSATVPRGRHDAGTVDGYSWPSGAMEPLRCDATLTAPKEAGSVQCVTGGEEVPPPLPSVRAAAKGHRRGDGGDKRDKGSTAQHLSPDRKPFRKGICCASRTPQVFAGSLAIANDCTLP